MALLIVFLLGFFGSAMAIDICPILGAQYPPALDLANDATFRQAINDLNKDLAANLSAGAWNATTFSLGAFSTSNSNATESIVYESHHLDKTAGDVALDANSVYRIGSMTKLLTVYLWLIHQGEHTLLDPITKYFPELNTPSNHPRSTELSPNWEEITVGELASQLGGISRNYALGDLTANPGQAPYAYNFTDLPVPACNFQTPDFPGGFKPCSQSQLIDGIKTMSAFFPPSYTPAYANDGFALMGMALQRLTNQSIEELYKKNLVEPLALNATSAVVPSTTTNAVIPLNQTVAGWNADLGAWSPAGGSFSSLNDFIKIGSSILNAKLLSRPTTRRWLKPKQFFDFFGGAIGMPWEISRVKTDNHSVDLYSKGGDYGSYHAALVLAPDYDFGFVVLTANADLSSHPRNDLQLAVAKHLIPGAIYAAKNQTARRFGGEYVSRSINSSVTFAIDDLPAMNVTSWLVQGVSVVPPGYEMRLMPSFLAKDTAKYVDFMGSTQSPGVDPEPATAGSYANDMNKCVSWATMGGTTVGGSALEQWRFTVDEEGNAVEAESLALGVQYERKK